MVVRQLPHRGEPLIRRLFPTRLARVPQAMAEFATTARGCPIATSTGGVLTRRGADRIVIDDPLKPRRRSTIGEYNLAGQHQQAPAPLGGGMVKPAWFKRYQREELPAAFERAVHSWDTANKASELADFSVCTSWGLRAPRFICSTSGAPASTTRN